MRQNSKRFRLDVWGWTTIVILLLYALFLLYPLSLLLKMAFSDGVHFTLENFAKFFSRKYYSITLLNSFKVSIAATIASVVVGVVLGYFMSVFKVRGAKLLRMCIVMATMSAPFVGAYAWIMLLGRNGVITNFLSGLFGITMPDIYGFNGIMLVFVTQLFPLVFLYVQGAMSKMDASLMEASENLGCTGFKRFFTVVLPLISPTVLAGALLVFVRAMSDFGTPMLIGEGYRTFTVILYNEFVGEVSQNKGFASAIAIIAILITMVVYFSQNFVAKKQAFSMNALHRIEKKQLHGFSNFIVHFITYVVVGISILPQLYVVYTSFLKTSGQIYVAGYSLQSYQDMFSRLGRSIQNTIVIPAVSLLIVVFLAVLIAYVAVRRRNVLSGAVDVISMIPYVIPGTVIGIAMISAFNREPLVLTGGMLIMVVALVVRRLPYTIRSSVAILQQIPLYVEEAALSLGSSKPKAFFTVTLPMMSSGVLSGAILSWVTLISELSTAILLYTGKTQTLTVAIYTQIVRGNYGIASAMATVLTVMTLLSLLIFNKISKDGDLTM
ncbi:MAG: ABC transporter permease [Oscillospiraceae bacterium]|jgi:iron(III)-transport system permease protein sfuB|nr:iron ABC transporter permease [Clostridiales bacterium]MDR3897539.1 iron ABC transporter permease [Oscillospiraceae bacterium]